MGLVASLGGIAAILIAVAVCVAAVFLAYVFLSISRVLESTKRLIDGARDETVPLLGEVKNTIRSVNKEIDRADSVMAAVSRIASTVEKAVSSPLTKLIAFSAGATRAVKRFGGKDDKGNKGKG